MKGLRFGWFFEISRNTTGFIAYFPFFAKSVACEVTLWKSWRCWHTLMNYLILGSTKAKTLLRWSSLSFSFLRYSYKTSKHFCLIYDCFSNGRLSFPWLPFQILQMKLGWVNIFLCWYTSPVSSCAKLSTVASKLKNLHIMMCLYWGKLMTSLIIAI